MTAHPKPYLTGWCRSGAPVWSHDRCAGGNSANPQQVWHPCPCPCHQTPEETPVTVEQTPSEQGPENANAQVNAGEQDPADDVVLVLSLNADSLNRALRGYEPDDWRDAARLLHRLRKVTGLLSTLDSTLVTWLYLHGEHGLRVPVDGIPGGVNITRGRARERWDASAVAHDYVEARIRANSGEAPDPDQVVEWVLEAVAAGYCRKTAIREVGLDVQDYYESEPGRVTASFDTGT